MRSILKKVMRIRNLHERYPEMYFYAKYYRKLEIKSNLVVIESSHGRHIAGSLFYLMKEMSQQKELQVVLVARDVSEMRDFLTQQKIENVDIVGFLSKAYFKLVSSAQYLLNDTTFYPFFNKKQGQHYINTWHGTPLKTLGKDVEIMTDVANVQRNFYMADKIILSNSYTQNIFASSFSLNGVFQGKMVVAPSPRNSVLLDKTKRDEMRDQLNLKLKKVSFYMPTWRGTSTGHILAINKKTIADLRYISKHLKDNDCFFVKLHPFQQELDLTEFDNIFPMPAAYELYEFLTAVDVLITDYSSIMYDFLLTDKKIILYTYDKDEYFESRGVYEDIDDYPFVKVEMIEELMTELHQAETDVSYLQMKEKFCPYDHQAGTKIVSDYILHNTKHPHIKETSLHNGKETVLLFTGGFIDNGITTALLNTLDNIDTSKRNYICIFGKGQLHPRHYFRVKQLPEDVLVFPLVGPLNGTLIDRLIYSLHSKSEKFNFSFIKKRVAKLMNEEFKREFGGLKVDHFIHYTGYERKYAEMLKHLPAEINTALFVHADMIKQYEARGNFSKKIIFSAYEAVSKVVLVNQNLKQGLIEHLPTIQDHIHVVNNFLGEDRVRALANENLFETLINTKIDYATMCSPLQHEQLDLQHILSHRKLLFQLSPTHEAYEELDMSAVLNDMTSEVALTQMKQKLTAADELILRATFGQRKLRLLSDLLNPNIKTFINIGRYDYEKGHERLIKAFNDVYEHHQNIRLIIIAPYGRLKKETLSWASESQARDAIFVLGRMDNPYVLLKHSDAFVLSSHFEALGLVLYEALAIGTKGITVDLPTTIEFLTDEAIIVENSEHGLYSGMMSFLTEENSRGEFDFALAKKRSQQEFEAIFKKE